MSNIHLINFDEEITEWVAKHKGLYRRYIDDLIIVFPTTPSEGVANTYVDKIMELIKNHKSYGLEVQTKKTEIRLYRNRKIYDTDVRNASLDYLGLIIDSKNVELREKARLNITKELIEKQK